MFPVRRLSLAEVVLSPVMQETTNLPHKFMPYCCFEIILPTNSLLLITVIQVREAALCLCRYGLEVNKTKKLLLESCLLLHEADIATENTYRPHCFRK